MSPWPVSIVKYFRANAHAQSLTLKPAWEKNWPFVVYAPKTTEKKL